jgi:hypothetical protein
MIKMIDLVLEDKIQAGQIIQRSHQHLAQYHLTDKRAAYLLDRLGML